MILWLVHLNTKKAETVDTLLKHLEEALGEKITEIQREKYHKDDNWRVHFTLPCRSTAWDSQVLETIRLAQKLAYDWRITGDCDYVVEGIAGERFRLSGVLWIHWQIDKSTIV
jgi:hypothetical protein